jgi:hypothetical protein
MRLVTIAVTFVALAAQVTPTHGTRRRGTPSDKLSCKDDVELCMEVVISKANQCNGGTVTYCLQPRSDAPSSCPNSYDHTNVYVNGAGVNLKNPALTAATCADTSDGVSKECKNEIDDSEESGDSDNSDDSDDSDDSDNSDNSDSSDNRDNRDNRDDRDDRDDSDDSDDGKKGCGNGVNVGLTCEGRVANSLGLQGLCVTVPHADGNHAQIIFAVKDGDGCEDTSGGWECSVEEDNSCSCGDSKSA